MKVTMDDSMKSCLIYLTHFGEKRRQGYLIYDSDGIAATFDANHVACGCGHYYLIRIDSDSTDG